MNSSSNPTPSSPPESTADDTEPFLRPRRSLHRTPTTPPLRTASRFIRQASSHHLMLNEPSVRVRERAAVEVEERQREWAYSKPVVALDIAWNLSFLVVSVVVLGLSNKEEPCVPLRVWILGYLLQGLVHSLCVFSEFRRRRRDIVLEDSSHDLESGPRWSLSSDTDSDVDFHSHHFLENQENSIMKHIESANTILSFIWWVLGFYWVTAGGQSLTKDSPQLYWLCITFLAFDVVIVVICVAVACLIGIAVCCCLPCILAILYAVADQEGATKEEIDQLPKYRFRMIKEFKQEDDTEESSRGVMTECDTDSDPASEHVIALEDAECCICLSAYDDGAELRELPCNHHFHCTCIDKWLLINATCPLCKFNILSTDNLHEEV
ncbi:Zinc finger, C3HC4 type (RING finger) family protein [Trifolium repens]|nr:Zinc finger, C3HC4 type (RING finger) family protein [Trifolium repens]